MWAKRERAIEEGAERKERVVVKDKTPTYAEIQDVRHPSFEKEEWAMVQGCNK